MAVIVVFNELFEAEALQISVKSMDLNMKHNDIPKIYPRFTQDLLFRVINMD